MSEQVTIRITLATVIPANKMRTCQTGYWRNVVTRVLRAKLARKALSILTFRLSEKPGVVETCWPH